MEVLGPLVLKLGPAQHRQLLVGLALYKMRKNSSRNNTHESTVPTTNLQVQTAKKRTFTRLASAVRNSVTRSGEPAILSAVKRCA